MTTSMFPPPPCVCVLTLAHLPSCCVCVCASFLRPRLPRAALANADIARIINSTEVPSVVRGKHRRQRFTVHKKNPLKNLGAMVKLNPYAIKAKRAAIKASAAPAKKAVNKAEAAKNKKASKAFYRTLIADEYVSSKAE